MGLLHWHFWFVQRKPLASSNSRHFIDIRDIEVWITFGDVFRKNLPIIYFAALNWLPFCVVFFIALYNVHASAYISGSMDDFFFVEIFWFETMKKKTTNLCLFFRSIGHCIDKTNIRYLCSSEVVHLKMSPVKPGTWDFVYFCAHFSISMRMFVDMFGIRIRGKRGCIEANA